MGEYDLDHLLEAADKAYDVVNSSNAIPDFLREFCSTMIVCTADGAISGEWDQVKATIGAAFTKIKWPDDCGIFSPTPLGDILKH